MFAFGFRACLPNPFPCSAEDQPLSTAAERTLQAQMTEAAILLPTEPQQTTGDAREHPPTATQAINSPTAAPTRTSTGAPPAWTLPPTSNLQDPIEIVFLPGGTSAFFQQPIHAGTEHAYTLRAAAGQTLIVGAASAEGDVYIKITGVQSGETLLAYPAKDVSWSGALPSSQDYRIFLTTDNPDSGYFLSVEVPADIAFEPGNTSAHIEGAINVYAQRFPDVFTRVRYLVQASAGQTMDVKLASPNLDALSMSVTGKEDGQPYRRYQVKNYGYYGTLPLTQGYYLDIYSVSGESTTFTLDVEIQ